MLAADECVGSGLGITGASKVVGREVVGGFVREVVDEPTVAERAVGYVGDVELPGGVDEAVGFVQGFEGGVFGLDGVDPCDCDGVSDGVGSIERRVHVLELAFRRVLAEHSDSPMYFVFPALRMESRAGMEDSRGVSAFSFLVSILVESGS